MRKINTHYLLLTASTVIAALTLIFAGGFTVIGHRGEYFSNRYGTVEHTFRSYDNALTDGADWLEIDLEQSSDGVLVISHDPTTNRLSGVNHVISQTPWSTLSQLPLGNSGEKIHSLEELFQHYRNDQRAKFVIETRRVNGQLTQERELLQLVAKYGMQHRVYYESFVAPSLQLIRELDPSAKTMLLTNTKHIVTPEWIAQHPYITSFGTYWDTLDGAGVNAIHAAGKQVYPWFNTSEPGDAAQDVISLGTDGVITNWTFKYRQLRGKEPLPKGTKFRVSDSTMLYAGAGAHAANVRTLNAGSTWTAYNRITDRGITWYELGGNQWVQAKGGALLDPTRRNQVVHQNAIVKILHGAATIFNTPSAGRTSLDRRLAKDSRWRTFGYLYDGKDVWYQVGTGQWISQH